VISSARLTERCRQEINDLAVSPLAPNILVSASNDHTVRICNLDKAYEKQPCLAICAGEGHKEGLLSLVTQGIQVE